MKTASVPKLEVSSIFIFFFSHFVVAVVIVYIFNSLLFHPVFLQWAVIYIGVCALYILLCALVNPITKPLPKPLLFTKPLLLKDKEIGCFTATITVVTCVMFLGIALSGGVVWLYSCIFVETMLIITTILKIIFQVPIDKLFSKVEKILIALLIIGLDFSLIITFTLFYEIIPQLHCFTLGEILDSAIVAIASMFATLIPLIYLLFKPVKKISKYRKAELNLIQP
ncbi:MAG: hypothetical protein F6K54_21880 [Okeania sp. SIO3B5]|uniref:hypothetical protein n=1 Tax=Okeania sp. SIO3B5 TaxID=2607811 RepID=UPI0014006742|nr:hypothetical protein [Okeania sp. SIO3B5]NEO55488.1 hypothetical protein [Okeania sp. SIO3B5]